MTFVHWLKRLATWNTRRKGVRRIRQLPARVKPEIEALENRLVPSTYHVTSTGGGNSGSGTSGTLRYLVDNVATDGDTIVFDVSGTISITGSVSIGHSITIDGSGQKVTVDGTGSGVRAFTINSGTVTLENLTISGKKLNQQGGGILNSGTLTLLNDTITGSNAGTGGGIYSSGTLTATNCTVYNNTATNGGGGGIGSTGTLKLISDTISGNSGGGVETINNPTTYIYDTIVAGNTGLDFSNTANGTVTSGGGNLYGTSLQVNWVTSGSFPDIQSTNPLLGTFQNNGGYTSTLALLAGSPALGAGNPNSPSFGSLSSTDQRGYLRVIAGKTDIGAVENQGQLFTLTAPGSQPSPSAGTAAAYNLGSFTYAGSSSSYSVSVNWNDGTTTSFNTSTTGALASQSHTYFAPGSYLITVTITDAYGNFSQLTTTAAIQGNITVNTTTDTDAVSASSSPVDSNGKVSLRSAIEYANATNYAGTIAFTSSLSGTIGLTIGHLAITDSKSLTIDGSGASITISGSALSGITQGGVFYVNTSATDAIKNLTISGGKALSGGGIYNATGNLTLTNDTISNNAAGSASSAKGFGGGIYNNGGTLTLTDDSISSNSASSNGVSPYSASGGGIYNSGTLFLSDSTIDANTTTGSGGGVFNAFGTATLSSDTIATNTATNAGAGIYSYGGTLALTSSTLANNTAKSYFGAGLFNSSGNVTLANDTFTGNYSGKAAGGIYNTSGTITIFNTIVDGNTSLNAPANVLNDVGGTLTSSGGNLYGASSGVSWNSSAGSYPDYADAANNPGLGSLQNNGGSTQTLAELPGSLALAKGLLVGQGGSVPTSTDQRGFTRVVNGKIDVGAFENQSQLFTLTAPANATVDVGQSASFSLGSFSYTGSAGNIWSVTVSWGDGSQTVFTTTTQGTLTPQSHIYTAASAYTVTVYVADAYGNFGQKTFTVTVDPAVSLSPSTVPTGIAGSPYTSTTFTASGGSGSGYTYTSSGSLDGLTLSTGGVLSGTPTSAGTFSFTVTATDSNGGTGSKSYTLQVLATTSVALSGSGSPSVYGQSVTLTATISSSGGATITPTGTVSFYDGSSFLGSSGVSSSVAIFNATGLAIGGHSFTAVYTGDTNFKASPTSNSVSQTVNQASTTVVLTGPGSATVYGQSANFTATVSVTSPGAGSPTGTVSFKDGAAILATVGLSGSTATFTTTSLAVAGHGITATYSGDTNFRASPTSNTVAQTVNQAATTIALVGSGSPTVFGQAVSFTVNVTAVSPGNGTPTGTVSLTDNGNPLTSLTLAGGTATFTTTALPGGANSIVATYNGDGNFLASPASSTVSQQVNPASTSTAVFTSSNPATAGQAITFTALVSVLAPGSGTASGTVQFFDGSTFLGSGSFAGGIASFTTTSLSVGNHSITAAFVATTNLGGSTSSVLAETVNAAPTPPTPPQPPQSNPTVAVGTDSGTTTQVNVYDAKTMSLKFAFLPFGAGFSGGARVAQADLNGDGVQDIIVGAGPGGGPQVVVYDGATQQPFAGTLGSFYGLGSTFTGGVYVAAGDVNGDGVADIIVGAGAGGGPQVSIFNGKNGSPLASFYAFAPTFTGGVRVAAGNVSGEGRANIIAAAGPGGGPQVVVFDGASLATVSSFFAFTPGFTGGVFVASGDVNGDGKADIIVGAGAGGGPQVAIYNGPDRALLSSFFAFAPSFTGGVRVGSVVLNGTGHAAVLAAAGPSASPQVTAFDSSTLTILDSFFAYSPQFSNGLFVAG